MRKNAFDAIVVGGGHNGLTSAAYLAKNGKKVLVLERRHLVGGAAVTEEVIKGFRFSRASYLAGLLRPVIIEDLELKKHGLHFIPRFPSSFTPTLQEGKYLMLGLSLKQDRESIAQFSTKDAENFAGFEEMLNRVRRVVTPFLDHPLPEWPLRNRRRFLIFLREWIPNISLRALQETSEVFLAPAQTILDRWFESDILKTTLATDAVIGSQISPQNVGSAYILLHHVMGTVDGVAGRWAYVKGGMGSISNAIASSATSHGAEILCSAEVSRIETKNEKVVGVSLQDGRYFESDRVLAGCSPSHTYMDLLGPEVKQKFEKTKLLSERIEQQDQKCGAFKINVALKELPNFKCHPGTAEGFQHRGTIHFGNKMEEIHEAFVEASLGKPASRPVIEMTLPSVLDPSLVDEKGTHVCQLFVQFCPYRLNGASWRDKSFKESFVKQVFAIIDVFAPNFSRSVIGIDALSPLDLEEIFRLPQGNIFHGSLALHQIGFNRPVPGFQAHRSSIEGLYFASAGAHPGGGVLGSPGRNAATIVLEDMKCN